MGENDLNAKKSCEMIRIMVYRDEDVGIFKKAKGGGRLPLGRGSGPLQAPSPWLAS